MYECTSNLRLLGAVHILRYLTLSSFYFTWMYAVLKEPASWRYYGLEKRLPSRRLHLVFA